MALRYRRQSAGADAIAAGAGDFHEISARGVAEGFSQWNEGPDSTMTNGTVSQVVGTNNRVLTVTYKGGQQSVTLPDNTPVTTFEVTDKTALMVGAHVVVRAIKNDDGSLTAGFVSVGKDGFVPG